MASSKTNACRILDAAHITYTVVEYNVNEEELDAITVAHSIVIDPQKVFKTLVLQGNVLPYFVVIVQSTKELDLKSVAFQSGNKSCSLLPQKQLLHVTGYIRGGCSPIGMKKKFPTYIDSDAFNYEQISISPGVRGQQIILSPKEVATITQAIRIHCE